MSEKWRTVQIFLDSKEFGIYEVEINPEIPGSKGIRCNCKFFSLTKGCKHAQFIQKAMIKNKGHYAVQVPTEVDNKVILEAMDDPKKFRDFLIHNAKVEVIK